MAKDPQSDGQKSPGQARRPVLQSRTGRVNKDRGPSELLARGLPAVNEFIDLNEVFIRASAIVSCAWENPEAGTLPGDRAPWQLKVNLINGDRVWLSGNAAQIVLRRLKIKSKNPHPKGIK